MRILLVWTNASICLGCIASIQKPASARCGNGLIPDPNGGNFCVPQNSSDSDIMLDYAPRELITTEKSQLPMDELIELIQLKR